MVFVIQIYFRVNRGTKYNMPIYFFCLLLLCSQLFLTCLLLINKAKATFLALFVFLFPLLFLSSLWSKDAHLFQRAEHTTVGTRNLSRCCSSVCWCWRMLTYADVCWHVQASILSHNIVVLYPGRSSQTACMLLHAHDSKKYPPCRTRMLDLDE